MRIIDADALMPLFMKKANTMKDRHGVKLGENWLLDYEDIKDVIDNAPTIDDLSEYSDKLWQKAYERGKAEGRKTGHWIDGTQGYYCSVCGEIDYSHSDHIYCGCCGADMREGGRE